MKLLHPIKVRCNNCNEILNINVDMECVSSYERSMGTEYEFEGALNDECPNCGNGISISLSVWEYPIGTVNYQEEECDGALIVSGPDYDPFEYDDMF